MKKIIMAVAIVCATVAAQAATASWRMSASNIYSGNATDKYSGTAYIFDNSVMNQAALFALFDAGTTSFGSTTAGFVATATVGTGVIAANTSQFNYGDQSTDAGKNNYSFYFAIVKDDAIYLSNILSKDANGTATPVTLAMGTQANGTSTFSNQAAGEGFQGAGHWSTHASSGGGEPVPEPTSGLLMLIGAAALALKRKVA